MQKLKYRNVTVSGKIGTGTTTLAKSLVGKLGWEFWSGGEFFRAYCRDHKIPLEETSLRSDDLAREVDFGMRQRLLDKKGLVLEAWLSGFVAQGVDGVLKILLVCTDDLRVDRVVNRDRVSVDEAKELIRKREDENFKKWKRVYRKEWQEWVIERGIMKPKEKIDFWDGRLYDLVIDTYSHSREETLRHALEALGYAGTHA